MDWMLCWNCNCMIYARSFTPYCFTNSLTTHLAKQPDERVQQVLNILWRIQKHDESTQHPKEIFGRTIFLEGKLEKKVLFWWYFDGFWWYFGWRRWFGEQERKNSLIFLHLWFINFYILFIDIVIYFLWPKIKKKQESPLADSKQKKFSFWNQLLTNNLNLNFIIFLPPLTIHCLPFRMVVGHYFWIIDFSWIMINVLNFYSFFFFFYIIIVVGSIYISIHSDHLNESILFLRLLLGYNSMLMLKIIHKFSANIFIFIFLLKIVSAFCHFLFIGFS